MRFDLRQLALVALLAGSPGLAFAADDWQALASRRGSWKDRRGGSGRHLPCRPAAYRSEGHA